MFCKNCGKKIAPNSKFCQYCGQNLVDVNNSLNNGVLPNYNPIPNYTNIPNQPIPNNPPIINNALPQQNNGNPILVMMVVVFIILAVAIPVVVYFVNDDSENLKSKEPVRQETPEIEYPNTQEPTVPSIPEVDNGTTKTINYSGYNYKLPLDYSYEEYEGNLIFYDNTEEWFVMVTVVEYNLDFYKKNIALVDAELSTDYEDVMSEIKTYQNIEYIETNFTNEGIKMRMLYTPLGSDETVLTMLMPIDNTIALNDLFKTVFPIVTTIEKDDKHVL